MLEKETATLILTAMEKLRQKKEHEPCSVYWCIRVCQAIVAKEAGYTSRNDRSASICETLRQDAAFQNKLEELTIRNIRRINNFRVV